MGGKVWAILGDVVACESVTGGKTSGGGWKVPAENQDALTDVGADEVKGHSGGGVQGLAEETFPW